MTDTPDNAHRARPKGAPPLDTPEDTSTRERILAAEYSLGLLEGEELLNARGREATEADFAWRRQWWDDWFVPLSDDVAGAEPGVHVWDGIRAEVKATTGPTNPEAGSNIVLLDMERRLRRWQWTAGIATAAAAIALAVLVAAPGADPIPQSAPTLAAPTLDTPTLDTPAPDTPTLAAAPAPLMASIPVGETLRLGVTFLPGSDEMLISAVGLIADGVHDHELWVAPAGGGALQSLGVVVPGEERRIALGRDIASNLNDGTSLVLTREPLGGKPDGVEAGPVVAQASLSEV